MQLRSYHAGSMREAMRLVRDEMGEDAVIVSTVEVEGGDVRVTAALERPEPVREPGPDAPNEPGRAADETGDGRDVASVVAAVLNYHGAATSLSDELVGRAAAAGATEPAVALGTALDETLRFAPIAERDLVKPLMLVGPPGSGKTATTAKLAARLVLRGFVSTVVSADMTRAAAAGQLASLTEILGVGLEIAATPDDLLAIFARSRAGMPMFVDCFATNPFDHADMARIGDFVAAIDAEPVLVLAAGLDATEAAEIAESYAALGATRMISTRLDHARRLGSLITAAFAGGLAISDAGVTAHVAHGLTALNPLSLARVLCRDPETATGNPVPQEESE